MAPGTSASCDSSTPDGVVDETDRVWRVTEAALALESDPSERRARLPAHRAFWFGWYAQFPDTELID